MKMEATRKALSLSELEAFFFFLNESISYAVNVGDYIKDMQGSHKGWKFWKKLQISFLYLPGLEIFVNLPWWLGIPFRGWKNVKQKIINLYI